MSSLRSYIPIICTFIIGVAVSVTLFVIVKNWEQTNQRIEFESRSRGYANAVQGKLSNYLGSLYFLGDFFNNSQQVTLQQFNVFAESALSRHPGIQAFSWNPLVKGNERVVYESLARKEGLKNFRFTEKTKKGALVDAAQRQEYVVVYYITPLETNKPALGYDIASDTTRLQAIDQAFKTGELTATDRITLVQETGTQFGVLVFLPLYQQGVSLKTSEARHKYRKGLVVEVLRLGDVVEAALKGFPDEGINLYLYDASAAKGNRLLCARPSRMSGMTEQPMDEDVIEKGIYWDSHFEIAGRQWKILFSPSPLYLKSKQSWQSWLILYGSLLLTAILILYLFKKLNYAAEIEYRVREQLRANQELADEIAERKQAEKAVQESEQKYRSFTDSSSDMVFLKDDEFKYIMVNQAYLDFYKCTEAEILGKMFLDIIPEERVRNCRASDIQVRESNKLVVTIEQDEDRIVETRKYPVRLKDGKIGVGGIARDITDSKLAEEHLKETLESLRKALGTTIQVMVSTIEVKDPYTAGHQVRSTALARAIATEMGLSQDAIEAIRMAGPIHDIGKLSIPAEILSKPKKLTEIEFSLIKEHARTGYEMLKDVESPWPLAEIVYQHHERMDGSGYPRNLKGDEILMEARILAVSDVVESMASHRPYRPALGLNAALEEIESNKGTLYDADVVDACLRLFREKGYQLERA